MTVPATTSTAGVDELFTRAFALHQGNQLDGAQKLYTQILERDPKHAHALHSLGAIAYARGRHAEATDLFQRAVALRPDEIIFCHGLAQALRTDPARINEAIVLLRKALSINPEFLGAWQALAEIHYARNDTDEAARAIRKVAELQSKNAQSYNQQGITLARENRLAEAIGAFKAGIACNPKGAGLYYNLGNVLAAQGQFGDAVSCLVQASQLSPKSADVYVSLSNAQFGKGDLDAALEARRQALALSPELSETAFRVNASPIVNPAGNRGTPTPAASSAPPPPATVTVSIAADLHPMRIDSEAPYRFANALEHHRLGELTEAENGYRMVLGRDPSHVEALHMLGLVAIQAGKLDEGICLIRKSLDHRDEQPLAHSNLGNALIDAKQPDAGLMHLDRAIALQPDLLEAHHNRGRALLSLHRAAEAVESLDYVLTEKSRFAPSIALYGVALERQGETEKALNHYDEALEIQPDLKEALDFKGALLFRLGRYRRAAQCYESLLRIAPDHRFALGNLTYCRLNYCEWTSYGANLKAISAGVRSSAPIITPLELAHLPSTAADQLQCARTFMSLLHPSRRPVLWDGEPYRHERIRLAYVSTDFQDHATAYLTAGLFESHDRSRFDVTLVSLGADDGGTMRRRLQSAADRFVDASRWQDDEVAKDLREHETDIVISLQGLLHQARWGILAHRPAPIQVNYLAHPGTSGADYIDFILADERVIPESDDRYYSEKVVRLPNSYQVTDNRRKAPSSQKPQRSQFNIPAGAFVFCCLNNPTKIAPDIFDVWCRLLKRVPNSILWLFEANAEVAAVLRREATLRDVPPELLHFARWSPLNEHVARYSVADLFLDTLPYNAHTTASDALWAGLPVLTCRGSTFAGRVGSSLLHAVGLPELICRTLQEYESMALALARDPPTLKQLRDRLIQSRENCPLFDTLQTTRAIEVAYNSMLDVTRRQIREN
jgi:predicted O-linked N-acetylglucosamine transferase (SPINDLY family)